MDFVQTKAKSFVVDNGRHIAEVIAMAENGQYRIYVAWEWKDLAEKKVFGLTKSRELFDEVNMDNIRKAAGYGFDIGGTPESKKIFKNIL